MTDHALTKRQREVLSLLVHGLSNKEIARVLGIAEATTKIHVAALVRALGARNRTEAAFMATGVSCEAVAGTLEQLAGKRVSSDCGPSCLSWPRHSGSTRST